MYYTREQHKRFLDKELVAISEEYLKKLNSKAIALLTDNEVYVTQFVKLDLQMADSNNADRNVLGSGQLILRLRRIKEFHARMNIYCSRIRKEMSIPRYWGEISWGNLRRHQVEFRKYIVSGRVKRMTMVSYCVVLLDCQ